MSVRIRTELCKKIRGSLGTTQPPEALNSALSYLELRRDNSSGDFVVSLPLKTGEYDARSSADNIASLKPDGLFTEVRLSGDRLDNVSFRLNRDRCIREILENDSSRITIPGVNSGGKKIIVEFSSPNIAKPFHVGHLRSTIIGNYIANVNDFLCNDVRRINYLGDWGTQFGFVQLGIDLLNVTEERMKREPIKLLYDAYVHANKLAVTDPSIAERARQIFNDLESGNARDIEKWETFRRFTVDELSATYERLGVRFDEYNWESTYNAKKISQIISFMESQGFLITDNEGRKVFPFHEKRNVPIIKSDGSTLYITRDIAAAMDRFDKYKFDAMYYVVDTAQNEHFVTLIKILEKMKCSWADRLLHVKFGRIKGMSTRKGSAVFLQDILDETLAVMRENQIQSPTTRVSLATSDKSTDILGISAVIINDLKQRRSKDYNFDWNKALDIKGDTGVKLQYVHCRLTSLEENSGAKLPTECDPSLLREQIIEELIAQIGRFDQTVVRSHRELEPCVLVNYLFALSHAINKGLKELRVKGEPEDVASQRLLVFSAAKRVLAQGMKLLGLHPLNKM
ncbi:probable arginine--tRNA ligase, mitochondrial [Neodiprion fabricii]|uniref:probable arginine--tRNA ligase, mitochondrial n=1 Tax=Neodiprion fabricii TaxID=2872261 RepID=UPI001ED9320A|nr:probable arginine--tRNA ligase, mitochondrial [Neodiprion fabricii]